VLSVDKRHEPGQSTRAHRPAPARVVWRARAWLRRHAYLVVALGAVLVLSRTIDFSPPAQVRQGPRANLEQPANLIGAFPERSFDNAPADPNAVQLRATLRRYTDDKILAAGPDMEVDERGEIISQPVVTTLLGVEAAIDQTVRLEDGALAINLALAATPRRFEHDHELTLEHELRVTSQRASDWSHDATRRMHLQTRGTLVGIEGKVHRIVFSVEEHLFSLDIELQRR
jgi:hypothetical protein